MKTLHKKYIAILVIANLLLASTVVKNFWQRIILPAAQPKPIIPPNRVMKT